jgi:hypothetical protein
MLMMVSTPTNFCSNDGVIDGFIIHQDTLDQLDGFCREVAKNLIQQRRWVLVP